MAYSGQPGETIWIEAFDSFEVVTARAVAPAREQFVRDRNQGREFLIGEFAAHTYISAISSPEIRGRPP